MHDEIQSLYRVFASNPIFGIEFSIEERAEPLEKLKVCVCARACTSASRFREWLRGHMAHMSYVWCLMIRRNLFMLLCSTHKFVSGLFFLNLRHLAGWQVQRQEEDVEIVDVDDGMDTFSAYVPAP